MSLLFHGMLDVFSFLLILQELTAKFALHLGDLETLDFSAMPKMLGLWQLLEVGLNDFCIKDMYVPGRRVGQNVIVYVWMSPQSLLWSQGTGFSGAAESRVCDWLTV